MAGVLRQISRKISTCKTVYESMKEPLSAVGNSKHDESAILLWKRLFFFVCCPAMLVSYLNVAVAEEEKPPEFKKYPYLRIRNKTYPWRDGVKTLFHNPHVNALPDGYEVIEGHH